LVDLLGRLGLALPGQVAAAASRVRRLARELGDFEFAWVDALAQLRILTPYQAAEINAGRGAALEVGPYLICEPLEALGYATVYQARERAGNQDVRLAVVEQSSGSKESWAGRFEDLARRTAKLASDNLAPIESWGVAHGRLWVACRYEPARSAADWLMRRGRMSAEMVEEIARQVTGALADCERVGIVHGDVSPRHLLLTADGRAVLSMPGLRALVRPSESYANAELSPEAFDSVAPERVATGAPSDVASELYAAGVLWWTLLAGRAPVPGASGLAKLRAAQTYKVTDIRQIAPEVSPPLAKAIERLLARDPAARGTHHELARLLGPGDATSRARLARPVKLDARPQAFRAGQLRLESWWRFGALPAIAALGIALVAAALIWPWWGPELGRRRTETKRPPPAAATTPAVPTIVSTASATQAAPPAAAPDLPVDGLEGELLLPVDRPVVAERLKLRAGQVVRGHGGRRAKIVVPPTGWKIAVEGLRMENIDFVRNSKEAEAATANWLDVRAARIEFRGCSWLGGDERPSVATAIKWRVTAEGEPERRPGGGGELRMESCLLSGVAAAIDARADARLRIAVENSLHLGPGPLVRLAGPADGPADVDVVVRHLTLRDAQALVECRSDDWVTRPGQIALEAVNCAFVPSAGGGLLRFVGIHDPAQVVLQLAWTGRGSVVAPDCSLATWIDLDGRVRATADDQMRVEGLVRGELGFAGSATAEPSASHVVRWQAPLESTEPPGIGDRFWRLPGLER